MNPALNPQHSVAVSASAGSGKTWLLVSRIVRLLIEGATPGGILALTFTRKAAAEMRERVNERLQRLAYADDDAMHAELALLGLGTEPALIERARGLYETLLFEPFPPRALTLHAFCQDLLARFALEAGVSPGFQLVEAETAVWSQAWRSLLARLHREPESPPAQALRTLIDEGIGEAALTELVFAFYAHRGDWWAYVEAQPDPLGYAQQQLATALQRYETDAEPPDSQAFAAKLRILYRWLQRIGDLRYVKRERLEPALDAEAEQRYALLCDALFKQDGEPYSLKLTKKQQTLLSDDEQAHFLTTHADLVAGISAERARRRRAVSLRRTGAALQLCVAALDALGETLARERALTFTDVEWRAYQLLSADTGAEWVRYKLDRRIDHLLIDEFQDTSPTQWRLLLPVLEEMAAGDAGRLRSAFVVGDAKQSIYGFRRANPELLETAAEWLKTRLDAPRVPLNASRRSAPAIIDFVNALFAPAEVGAPIGYVEHSTWRESDSGRVEVAPPIEDEPEPANDPEAAADESIIFVEALRDPLRFGRELSESLRAHREAEAVALRIRDLVSSGVAVRGDGDGGERPIGHGDVIVLARARTHLRPLEDALTQHAIPFVGSSRGTLLDTSEGRDLLALLRFLDAPHRALELAQTLRSPMFSVSDEALMVLATQARGHGDWLAALHALAGDDPRLAYAAQKLAGWRAAARSQPAHDLIDRIYCEGDVAARYEAALPTVAAARVRGNLGSLAQLALDADSGRYPTLGAFVSYLESAAASAADAPDEAPPGTAAGAVRIMTIHAAKGLEAPAVFLVNAGRVSTPGSPSWLIDWPPDAERPQQFMLAPRASERDEEAERLLALHRAREAREELNLLYVAVTRARQFLHISGFRPARGSSRPSWHELARAALERLPPTENQDWPGTDPGARVYSRGEFRYMPPEQRPQHAPPDKADNTADDARLRAPLAAPGMLPVVGKPSGDEGTHDPQAARRGAAIHALLQWLGDACSTEDAVLHARLAAQLQSPVGDADFAAWLAQARGVLASPALARFFDPQRRVRAWNEVAVSWVGEDGPRNGVIDRLVDDGETLWILDYKTHPNPDPAALADLHAPQLRTYAQAIGRLYPARPLRAGLVLTATAAWLELSL